MENGLKPATAAAESTENLGYLSDNHINVCTVASPGPDPSPRGGGQLPDPNKSNSTLTSGTRGEALTPNPNECNSTLKSGTKNIYPYPYIDVDERGHRLRILHVPR